MPRKPIVKPQLLKTLLRNPDGVKLKDLMETIGVTKKAVYNALEKLKDKGEIEHVPYGKYKLTADAYSKYRLLQRTDVIKKTTLSFEPKSGLADELDIDNKKLGMLVLYNQKVMPWKFVNYTELLLKQIGEDVAEHYDHIKAEVPSTEELQFVIMLTFAS